MQQRQQEQQEQQEQQHATREQLAALNSRSSDALLLEGLRRPATPAPLTKSPAARKEAGGSAAAVKAETQSFDKACPLTAEDFASSEGPAAALTARVRANCDFERFSGQELCDSCSCAIFNGLFEALTAAGVKPTSIDAAINSCADALWQGLMDSGALPLKTQLHLSTCEPGQCAYTNSTAAVAAADKAQQSSTCPMTTKAFSNSPPLRASISAACNASAVSGQALCNSCSCTIFNGLFDALAFAGHSVSSVDGTISKCAETLWQGLLDTAALPQQTQAFLAACKPGDCVYSAATAAVVATDVDYQAPNCPLSVQQFASSASLRQAVVAACDATKRSGRALCKSCYCTALNAVYQSSQDAKAALSSVDAGDCVFRLWASMSINGTATIAANDTAQYDTCQPFKALHLQCPAPQNSALHAVFYDEAKSLVAGQLPPRKAASSAITAKDAAGGNSTTAAAAAATCPLTAGDYTASSEFRAAVRSSCDSTTVNGTALCTRCYCGALQTAFVMEFRALSGNATAAQAHDWGSCHAPMLAGMQASGELSDAAWSTLQSCDLAAALAGCAMDDSHAVSIEALVGAWPAGDDKNMTRSLNVTQLIAGETPEAGQLTNASSVQNSTAGQAPVKSGAQGQSRLQLLQAVLLAAAAVLML
ncbi:hypothetical protein OEZ85_003781 [Tetradesmus obliquus]|uniref:SPARK domain-containing protein n=1 Tax=Tetradesmus obliquus TaxID=3088 RepID=A0ABY8UER6_TETOB|nr:hypothetical protein OEZ85_003781 [Tetradesmus obliquus]